MDEAIKSLCAALKEEAEAVISYTDKITSVVSGKSADDTAGVFEAIRLDEIEHIQKLCIELTRLVTTAPETKQEE
jgi:hypothetical protein